MISLILLSLVGLCAHGARLGDLLAGYPSGHHRSPILYQPPEGFPDKYLISPIRSFDDDHDGDDRYEVDDDDDFKNLVRSHPSFGPSGSDYRDDDFDHDDFHDGDDLEDLQRRRFLADRGPLLQPLRRYRRDDDDDDDDDAHEAAEKDNNTPPSNNSSEVDTKASYGSYQLEHEVYVPPKPNSSYDPKPVANPADYFYGGDKPQPDQMPADPSDPKPDPEQKPDPYTSYSPQPVQPDSYGSSKPDPSEPEQKPADPYDPKPVPEQKPDAYSTKSGDIEGPKTKLPPYNPFFEYVIFTDGYHGGRKDISHRPWNIDCNKEPVVHKFGYIIGLWDNRNNFKDIDKVKCTAAREPFKHYEMDSRQQHRLDFWKPAAEYNATTDCPENHVLTALFDDFYDFDGIKHGKCTKLIRAAVDYSQCETIDTNYRDSGISEPYKRWLVECPRDWAMVGLRRTYERVEFVKCCRIQFDKYYSH